MRRRRSRPEPPTTPALLSQEPHPPERLQQMARELTHLRDTDSIYRAPTTIDQLHIIAELQRQIDELKGVVE